jgi:tetratricopeptide (TPR) repeat protein
LGGLRRAYVWVYGLALGLALASAPAGAQRAADEEEEKGPPSQNLDAVTARILGEAVDSYNEDDYAGARAALAKLNLEKLGPYERGRVEQLLAAMVFAEGNYAEAREHLELAIASGGLNEQELASNRFQIAQSYMGEENWAQAVATLESWFETAVNPNSAAYYMLAAAYYQQGEESDSAAVTARLHDRALVPAIKAVELAEKPQEGWVQLVVALLMRKEDYRGAVPWIERLVELAPDKKSHWLQLSSVYQEIDEFESALAVTQLAHTAGLLTEDSEIRRLADLLAYNGIPYRGGQILEQAIADGKMKPDAALYEKLANCWMAAGELDKSIKPLTHAADLATTGDLYVRLGEVQVQGEDWAAAQVAIERGLSKGSLRDHGYAQLYMGIVLLEQDKPCEARQWFVRAHGSERYRNSAERYIQFIDSQDRAVC